MTTLLQLGEVAYYADVSNVKRNKRNLETTLKSHKTAKKYRNSSDDDDDDDDESL